MTENEYRAYPAISRSELWRIRESPEKFKYYQEHPESPTVTLLFGQVFHKMLLEPSSFADEFVVAPKFDRRTKTGKAEWDSFAESVNGRTIIDAEMMQKASDMARALYEVPFVKKLLSGEHEKPLFWKDDITGEDCKCRLDAVVATKKNEVIIDIKTTTDASNEGFMRSAIKYGYDFQAAMYSEGYEKNTGKKPLFVFIAIEKDPPYAANIFQADEVFIQRGYDIFRELIGTYHSCKETGNYFGYLGKYQTINNLGLPAYLAKEIE